MESWMATRTSDIWHEKSKSFFSSLGGEIEIWYGVRSTLHLTIGPPWPL